MNEQQTYTVQIKTLTTNPKMDITTRRTAGPTNKGGAICVGNKGVDCNGLIISPGEEFYVNIEGMAEVVFRVNNDCPAKDGSLLKYKVKRILDELLTAHNEYKQAEEYRAKFGNQDYGDAWGQSEAKRESLENIRKCVEDDLCAMILEGR